MRRERQDQRSRQKTVERLYLDRFLELVERSLTFKDHERPDFLLDAPEERLGVEVTQLFKDKAAGGSGAKRNEARRAGFLWKLAHLHSLVRVARITLV